MEEEPRKEGPQADGDRQEEEDDAHRDLSSEVSALSMPSALRTTIVLLSGIRMAATRGFT